ncbi:hypothetical protein [uncultured Rikenella sp.]|uniref:hypothetical protein n=1 Tax=uncultured Rikenella sp. TaxID=368003 RepID=UPI0026385460|nr:hypothetical protein [uncultured Rikenella sp.]
MKELIAILIPILSLLFPIWNLLQKRKKRRTASLRCNCRDLGKGKYVLKIRNKGQAEAQNIRLQELQGVDIIDEELFPCNCHAQDLIQMQFYLTKDICPEKLEIRVIWDDKDKKDKWLDKVFPL